MAGTKKLSCRIPKHTTVIQWTLGMGDLRCFDSAWLRSASQTTSTVVYLGRIQITEDNPIDAAAISKAGYIEYRDNEIMEDDSKDAESTIHNGANSDSSDLRRKSASVSGAGDRTHTEGYIHYEST